MAKLPFMQWYPADWIKDTRHLSLAAKGAYTDILNLMWINEETRGHYSATRTGLIRAIGIANENLDVLLSELSTVCSVTNHNENITFMSRRITKEETVRKNNQIRQRRHRKSRTVTPTSRLGHKDISEVRSHIAEDINNKDVNTTSPEPQKPAASGPAQTHPWLLGLELYLADPKLMNKIWTVDKAWMKAYPGIDIGMEIKKAHAWEITNPDRAKTNRIKFFNTWLSRAQDRPRMAQPGGLNNAPHGSSSVQRDTPIARRAKELSSLRKVGDEGDSRSLFSKFRNQPMLKNTASDTNAGGSGTDAKPLAGL